MKSINIDFKIRQTNSPNNEMFEEKIKNTIFGILYILLKDEKNSIVSPIILQVIDIFQIIRYSFADEVT